MQTMRTRLWLFNHLDPYLNLVRSAVMVVQPSWSLPQSREGIYCNQLGRNLKQRWKEGLSFTLLSTQFCLLCSWIDQLATYYANFWVVGVGDLIRLVGRCMLPFELPKWHKGGKLTTILKECSCRKSRLSPCFTNTCNLLFLLITNAFRVITFHR